MILSSNDSTARVPVILRISIDGGTSKFAVAQRYFTYIAAPLISSVSPGVAVTHQRLPLVFRGSGLQYGEYTSDSERIMQEIR